MSNQYQFAMVGIGVMGRNFLYNMADHGFKVLGYNKNPEKTKVMEAGATPGTAVKGVNTYKDMADLLEVPRRIMLLVPAGKPVDDVIEEVLPFIEKGDIIIDGGNSHYTDTVRRVKYLTEKGIHFMGMGVSGGELGARLGPSIMPGGDVEAWHNVQPMLEAVSAKVNGVPCVAHLGKDAAGHYVKMVHNGIEYSIMQLLTECYDILHRGAGMSNDELYELFKKWNEGDLQSFLVEITRDIFLQPDDKTSNRLLDMILDKAGAKGTGKWTSQDAMELGVPIPSIDMAVTMRNLSGLKEERVKASALYPNSSQKFTDKETLIKEVHDALYTGTLVSYAQGLALLHKASAEWKMEIPMQEVVRVWRGGCIIRSTMLEVFIRIFNRNKDLPNILLDAEIAALIKSKEQGLRNVISKATLNGYPVGGLMTVLSYVDAYTTARLPTNLLQAQRDNFGAHTYQRLDMEGSFHTEWNAHNG